MDLLELEVKLYKALAHPVRLAIVKKLLAGESCVCELQDNVEFSQSNLSQHLNLLKNAGLVKSKKKGLYTYYEVSNKRIVELVGLVEELTKMNIKEMLGV